jgi:aminoglycoside N3'-acetyltransferase
LDNSFTVKKENIKDALYQLGITAGCGLMVHSSFKSLGNVEGGPKAVIEAILDVITPEGTLIMPSFNHGGPFNEGKAGYYDPNTTRTCNGIIPDTFWRMPDVFRSLDPTHPFAAWGKNAERYIHFHHRTLTMGPKSPLGQLYEDDGLCLLIGVDYKSNTFHHAVEMCLNVPCLGQRSEAYPVLLPDGRLVKGRTWAWRDGNCPFTDTALYSVEMKDRNLQKESIVGNSKLICFRLKDCFQVVSEFLKNGTDKYPPCSNCKIRPWKVPQTVSSDWDREKQCIKPDSEAWSY